MNRNTMPKPPPKPASTAPRTAPARLGPRRRPTQTRARERVERILLATRTIMERDGVAALTTPLIARQARISVGSFYQYFPNKESVLLAIYEEYLQRMRSALESFDAGAGTPPGWGEYFPALLQHLKTAELRDPSIHELFGAIRSHPELERLEAEHTGVIVDFIAGKLARFGARAPRAKLLRLATFLYSLNDASWYYHARVAAARHRAEARDWELRAAMAVIASVFEAT